MVEDKLFATLDPVSRGINIPNGQEILLVDTVGFINKLPHDLVEAYKSTLEEAVYADLLLHVVDSASPNLTEQISVVETLLESLGCKQPIITVYNKTDILDGQENILPIKRPAAYISATNKVGLDELVELIEENLPITRRRVKLLIPYTQGQVLSQIHEQGKIIEENYRNDGVFILADLDSALYGRFAKFKVEK